MSNTSISTRPLSRPLGTAMVGGAIAMAILDLLVKENLLTIDDVHGALRTAQGSLATPPASPVLLMAQQSYGRS